MLTAGAASCSLYTKGEESERFGCRVLTSLTWLAVTMKAQKIHCLLFGAADNRDACATFEAESVLLSSTGLARYSSEASRQQLPF